MLELETRTGEWAVYVDELYGDLGFIAVNKNETPEGVSWSSVKEPDLQTFSTAKKTAIEYATHVIGVQDPQVRDKVFIGCPANNELIQIKL